MTAHWACFLTGWQVTEGLVAPWGGAGRGGCSAQCVQQEWQPALSTPWRRRASPSGCLNRQRSAASDRRAS